MTDKYRFNSIEILVSENNCTNVFIDGIQIRGVTGLEFVHKTGDKREIKLNLTIER